MERKRHLNGLMLIFSIIGGIIGYIVGEYLINFLMHRVPNVILVGIYFGCFAFFVCLMCLLAELIKPKLTGILWASKNSKLNFFVILPAVLIIMFGVGCLTQFIYSLDPGDKANKEIQDYVILMDNSGSMVDTDPRNVRVQEIDKLVEELGDDKRIAYFAFTEVTDEKVPLDYVTPKTKDKIHNAITETVSSGMTDIQLALDTALESVEDDIDPNRKMAVILVSDGWSDGYYDEIIRTCNEKDISIHSVGMGVSMFGDSSLLSELADETGGEYYDIQSADQLSGVFDSITTRKTSDRLLLDRRSAKDREKALLGIERILFIAIFGVLLGLAIGLLFDNKQLLKNLMIGGTVTGLLAGLLMEIGMYAYFNTRFCRLGMDILLSLVVCTFTSIIAYQITQYKPSTVAPPNQYGYGNGSPMGNGSLDGSPLRFD